jgi:hypothetical protein
LDRYLLDSNFFIRSENNIPFDVFPGFWTRLAELLELGEALIHESVVDELSRKEDDLLAWYKGLNNVKPVKASQDVLEKYLEICAWPASKAYDKTAIRVFTDDTRADAWLCAEACVSGYVLVTYETSSNSIKTIKIPNVCDAFGIACINGFDFMRKEGFRF